MHSHRSRRGLLLVLLLTLAVVAALDLLRHDSFLRDALPWQGPGSRHPGLERLERTRVPVPPLPQRP